jgi:hypothetical protein
MERYIDYDFSEFERIMFNMKIAATPSLLVDLKNELNTFFKDSTCKDVIYTNNTDKIFFGMSVMPIVDADKVYDILQSTDQYRVSSYYLELDSKLFKQTLGLSARELVAVLLHEVGHMVKDSTPMTEVRHNIDVYLMKNKETIGISDSVHYKEILAFGIKDALRKVTSLFENRDEELIADEFVVRCGYGADLESAFNKIIKNSYNINKDVDNKIILLSWVLRLYKDVKLRRITAIRAMRKGKDLTPSKLEKKEMDNVIRRLERIDDDALLESVFDDLMGKYRSSIKQMKYKGIRSFDEDLYEFSLRAKNIETQEDAYMLLRQINTRMALIDDYIMTEDLAEDEKKRWFALYDKYQKLREDLSKKAIYQNKNRLYINYPAYDEK